MPTQEAAHLVRTAKAQVHRTFTHAVKGFSASIPEAALAGIGHNPNVASIEFGRAD